MNGPMYLWSGQIHFPGFYGFDDDFYDIVEYLVYS